MWLEKTKAPISTIRLNKKYCKSYTFKKYYYFYKNIIKYFYYYTYFNWYVARVYKYIFSIRSSFSQKLLYINTSVKNIRYIVSLSKYYTQYSNALLLRRLSILNKSKWKNPMYYYLSLKFLLTLPFVKSNKFNTFYLKGRFLLSFLYSFKYWNDILFSKYYIYILNFNKNLNKKSYKRKQSIKRRLLKRIIKMEKFKL